MAVFLCRTFPKDVWDVIWSFLPVLWMPYHWSCHSLAPELHLVSEPTSCIVLCRRRDNTRTRYVVRVFRPRLSAVLEEAQRLADRQIARQSPFAVLTHAAFVRQGQLWVVQECGDKGSLEDVVRTADRPIPEDITAKIAAQVRCFLWCCLWGQGIRHERLWWFFFCCGGRT